MTRLEELQGKYSRLERDVKTIEAKADTEGRAMTATEDAEVNRILDEIDNVKASIDTALRANRILDRGERVEIVQDEADRGFEGMGDFFQAVARAKLPAGSTLGGRPTGVLDRRLLPRAAASGMNEGLPGEGGFLVDTDYSTTLLKKTYDSSPLLQLVRRMTVGPNSNGTKLPYFKESSRATGSRLGGLQAYWLGEAGSPTAKKPEIGLLELQLKKLIALAYSTDELLQDAAQLGQVIASAFTDEMRFVLQDAIVNGNGAGKPLGIMNSPALVTIAKEDEQEGDSVVRQNIAKMYAACFGASRARGVWLVNSELIPALMDLSIEVGTGGLPIFMPAGGLSASPFNTLLGRPIYPIEQCAALGDLGDIIFMDPLEYLVIEKGGIQTATSMHVNFTTDEMCFRFVYRVDGQPTWSTTLTPYKGAQEQSPYVTLAERA